MSATNKTTNYDLPIFVGTDKPSWLGDWNSAMTAIDTAIAGAKSTGDSATTVAGQAKSTAEAASETATTASETAAAASTAASNATTIANNANTQAGDAKTDAHAALEMTTELQEKFAGNRVTHFYQLYPNITPGTEFSGRITIFASNYNASIRGSLTLMPSAMAKLTKTSYENTTYLLVGVLSGNPYNLTPTSGIAGNLIYLGATLCLFNKNGASSAIATFVFVMIYNSTTQRTEIYAGCNELGEDGTLPADTISLTLYTNVIFIDNDIESQIPDPDK